MRISLFAVAVALSLPGPALAAKLSARFGGGNLIVKTDPRAFVVLSDGQTNGETFQADASGTLRVHVANLPVTAGNTLVIDELINGSSVGSQLSGSFFFIPGSGFSIGNHFYIATPISFSQSDDLDGDIGRSYGTGSRLATWEDLEADSASGSLPALFLAAIGLPVEGSEDCRFPNLFVSYQGNELDGSRGRYFVTNFTGSSPSACAYASYQNIGNALFLGSYSWPGQALVYIPTAVYSSSVAAATEVTVP